MHQSLVILGDPDASILVDGDCSFAEGVRLGDEFPIARTLEQFRRDERAGLMLPTTEAAVEAEFGPGRLLVAAMGAVSKPSGEIRPLHGATDGVGLNNKIQVLDKLEVPKPDE